MSDLYLEELVSRKKTLGNKLICYGMLFVTFMFWVSAYLESMMYGGLPSLTSLVPAFIMVGVCFYYLPKMNVEWEYTYVSGELDIDKIFNRAKRKRVGSYIVKEADIIAPANSHRLDYYNNNQKMKVRDFSSLYQQNQKNVYAMIIDTKKGKEKVLFEPSEAMLKDMRVRAPRKVFTD